MPRLKYLAPAPAGPAPRLRFMAPAPAGPSPRLQILAPEPAGPWPREIFLAPALPGRRRGRPRAPEDLGKCEENPMGPHDSLSILLVSMNLILVFQKHVVYPRFFVSRNALSREGKERYERTSNGVYFAVFQIYMPLVNEN